MLVKLATIFNSQSFLSVIVGVTCRSYRYFSLKPPHMQKCKHFANNKIICFNMLPNLFELLKFNCPVLLLYFAEKHSDNEHKYRGSNPFLNMKCDIYSFQNDILSYLSSSPANKVSFHWAWDSIAVR